MCKDVLGMVWEPSGVFGAFRNVWKLLETFGITLITVERLESFLAAFESILDALGACGSVWQARQAGKHNPMCIYGMVA